MPSLAMPKKTTRETQREYLSVKPDDPSFPAPIYAWLSRPPWHATLMSLKQAIEAEPREELCEDGAGARSPQPPLSCVSD